MKVTKKFFNRKSKSTFKLLKLRLEQRSQELANEFRERHFDADKWLKSHGVNMTQVWLKGSRGLVAGAAAGVVLLSSGVSNSRNLEEPTQKVSELPSNKIVSDIIAKEEFDQRLAQALKEYLGSKHLTLEEQVQVTQTISDITGVKVVVELDGNRLNTNLGLIGLEQHLPLYPGETISEHFSSSAGSLAYGSTGMTAGRGAFGYFAPDRYHLTQNEIDQEKYYVVVQTFLSSGWKKKPGLTEWYKHRKVVVVNPANGRVVVGNIADSGPDPSTGKSFGGSPELMDQLGLYRGQTKGKVFIFFIDDNSSNPKLGPV